MSHFGHIPLFPTDPILGLTCAFKADARKNKVNLGVGLYKTEKLVTPILPSVKAAEAALLHEEESKEYFPIEGQRTYIDAKGALVFGEEFWKREKNRIAGFQTVGGTSALKISGVFIKEEAEHPIWIPQPSWINHVPIFLGCHLTVEHYPYYDKKTYRVNFPAMKGCLEKMPEGATVLMQASCHNPTGCDPDLDEWKSLCALFQEKKLIPFFDLAYQGLGRGIAEDAEGIRHFAEEGLEMLVAVSNAKNFSLYGERAGGLFVVAKNPKIAEHVFSRIRQIIRTDYSNPPMHGAKIVSHILSTPALRGQWAAELEQMRQRIAFLRNALCDKLAECAVDFNHVRACRGMFGFLGLNGDQVNRLATEYGIYMPSDGRINLCGLNQNNIDYVVSALASVARE